MATAAGAAVAAAVAPLEPAWVTRLVGVASRRPSVEVYAVAIDGRGDVYLGGRFDDRLRVGDRVYQARGGDSFAARLSGRTGAVDWLVPIGGPGQESIRALAVGPDGRVVVAGSSRAEGATGDATPKKNAELFVVSLAAADGVIDWQRSFPAEGGRKSSRDTATGLAVDGVGDLVLSLEFEGELTLGGDRLVATRQPDCAVARLRGRDGAPVWARRLSTPPDWRAAHALAVDAAGTAYLAGRQGSAALVLALTIAGDRSWSSLYSATRSGSATAIADLGDGVVIGGSFDQELYTPNRILSVDDRPGSERVGFLARLAPDGTTRWAIPVSHSRYTSIRAVAAAGDGTLLAIVDSHQHQTWSLERFTADGESIGALDLGHEAAGRAVLASREASAVTAISFATVSSFGVVPSEDRTGTFVEVRMLRRATG